MAEIINIPFNESDGATTAADASGNSHNATLTNVTFATGKSGNCAHFDGTGVADINEDVVDFSGDFTILAWVKPQLLSDGVTGRQIGVHINTAELNTYYAIWATVLPDTWGFVQITKEGSVISFYLDGVLQGQQTAAAAITGISLIQDIYETEYAVADVDSVEIFDTVLTDEEVNERLNEVGGEIEYTLEGVNFRDFGIRVQSSEGVLDLPSLKTPPTIENDNYHGRMLDLQEKRYQEREITLNCWLKASSYIDFTEKIRAFYDLLDAPGTQRLMIGIHPVKPLAFEVYCEEGVPHEKRWHDGMMIGTFTLKLKEPDPVKRIIRVRATGETTVQLNFNSDKLLAVSWGDGSDRETVHGDYTENALTHTYETPGIYYIVLGGVIEELTDFNVTNGSVVWQRL